ncbi:MAG: hypothetical protein C5B54_02720 [Acidobacteria bacterium]|nr:MAG: hypothetical protein C5B54_02720 [Acidobacteriota bacterium]
MKATDSDPISTERNFFSALVQGDTESLGRILSDDLILIDVMRGGEVTKPQLLAIISSGQFKFESIQPLDPHVRQYGSTAVITGRTEMKMIFGATQFTVQSRYTHVFVNENNQWRLVSAQGTQIIPEDEKSGQ